MDSIRKSFLFRTIGIVLIITFISLDMAWAYPPEHNAANSALAVPSLLQQPVNEHTAQFQRSVFSQGALLASVYDVGEYFFGNEARNIAPLPAKHVIDVVDPNIRQNLSSVDTEIINIVPVEYLKRTAPDGLKAALYEIGFKGRLPDEGVVFILYRKGSERFLVQIAKKDRVSPNNLPGYEWVVSDKYVVKYIPENYTEQESRVASPVIARPAEQAEAISPSTAKEPPKAAVSEPVAQVNISGRSFGIKVILDAITGKMYSIDPFAVGLAATALVSLLSSLQHLIIAHPIIVTIAAVAGYVFTLNNRIECFYSNRVKVVPYAIALASAALIADANLPWVYNFISNHHIIASGMGLFGVILSSIVTSYNVEMRKPVFGSIILILGSSAVLIGGTLPFTIAYPVAALLIVSSVVLAIIAKKFLKNDSGRRNTLYTISMVSLLTASVGVFQYAKNSYVPDAETRTGYANESLDSAVASAIRKNVQDLSYNKDTADMFVSSVTSWKDHSSRPIINIWNERLNAARQKYNNGKNSQEALSETELAVAREIRGRIAQEIRSGWEGVELNDILRYKKAQCVGNAQLFYVIGTAVGLTMNGVESEERVWNAVINDNAMILHTTCAVSLADGRIIMIDYNDKIFETLVVGYKGKTIKQGDRVYGECAFVPWKTNISWMVLDTNGIASLVSNHIAIFNAGTNDPDKALYYFNNAIALNPQSPNRYMSRGAFYTHTGKYDDALTDFNKAIQLGPNIADAYYGRGNVFVKREQYAEAISDYDEAIKRDPKLETAYLNRGHACIYLKRYEQTRSDFEKAIELDPSLRDSINKLCDKHGLPFSFKARYWAPGSAQDSQPTTTFHSINPFAIGLGVVIISSIFSAIEDFASVHPIITGMAGAAALIAVHYFAKKRIMLAKAQAIIDEIGTLISMRYGFSKVYVSDKPGRALFSIGTRDGEMPDMWNTALFINASIIKQRRFIWLWNKHNKLLREIMTVDLHQRVISVEESESIDTSLKQKGYAGRSDPKAKNDYFSEINRRAYPKIGARGVALEIWFYQIYPDPLYAIRHTDREWVKSEVVKYLAKEYSWMNDSQLKEAVDEVFKIDEYFFSPKKSSGVTLKSIDPFAAGLAATALASAFPAVKDLASAHPIVSIFCVAALGIGIPFVLSKTISSPGKEFHAPISSNKKDILFVTLVKVITISLFAFLMVVTPVGSLASEHPIVLLLCMTVMCHIVLSNIWVAQHPIDFCLHIIVQRNQGNDLVRGHLIKIGPAAVPTLIKVLCLGYYIKGVHKDVTAKARVDIIDVLGGIGDPRSYETIKRASQDNNNDVRKAAEKALLNIKPETNDKQSGFTTLNSINPFAIGLAATALALIFSVMKDFASVHPIMTIIAIGIILVEIPWLCFCYGLHPLKHLGSYINMLRSYIATRIKIHSHKKASVESLIVDLKDRNYKILQSAQEKLVNIGIPAVPSLVKALGDSGSHNSIAATLIKINDRRLLLMKDYLETINLWNYERAEILSQKQIAYILACLRNNKKIIGQYVPCSFHEEEYTTEEEYEKFEPPESWDGDPTVQTGYSGLDWHNAHEVYTNKYARTVRYNSIVVDSKARLILKTGMLPIHDGDHNVILSSKSHSAVEEEFATQRLAMLKSIAIATTQEIDRRKEMLHKEVFAFVESKVPESMQNLRSALAELKSLSEQQNVAADAISQAIAQAKEKHKLSDDETRILWLALTGPGQGMGDEKNTLSSLSSEPNEALEKIVKEKRLGFVMIKPDGISERGRIINMLEAKGLKMIKVFDPVKLDEATAREFYKEHEGKPFFAGLLDYIQSGVVIPILVQSEKEDAIGSVRDIIGPTKGTIKETGAVAAGTIRGDLMTEADRQAQITPNRIHASDSIANAVREASLAAGKDAFAGALKSLVQTNVVENTTQPCGAARLFDLVGSAMNDRKGEYTEADRGMTSLIFLARKAKKENQKLIIGLETDWIPGMNVANSLQHQAITNLMKEIDQIGEALKSMGLDNVEIIHGNADSLAGSLTRAANGSSTDMHNIVVMASVNTINSDSFKVFRDADVKDKPFLAGIDPTELVKLYEQFGESVSKQLHIKLASLLYIALEVASGKEPSQAPWIKYDPVTRILLLIPSAEPMDYEILKSTYKAEVTAQQAA